MVKSNPVSVQVKPVGGFPLYDNFEGIPWSGGDGFTSPDGKWFINYVSGGFARVVPDVLVPGNHILQAAPKLDRLHSYNIQTTRTFGTGIHGRCRVRVDQRLPPGVAWYTYWPFLVHVAYNKHVYFNLKPNGWEIGKKDNNAPQSMQDTTTYPQEFILQGSIPTMVVGQWTTLEWWVAKDRVQPTFRIKVAVNGTVIADVLDNQPWQRTDGTRGTGTSPEFLGAQKNFVMYGEASQESWDDIFLEAYTF